MRVTPLTPITFRLKIMGKLSITDGTYYQMYLDDKVEFYKLKEELLKYKEESK